MIHRAGTNNLAANFGGISAKTEVEVRDISGTGKSITPQLLVILRAVDLVMVCFDDVVRDKQEPSVRFVAGERFPIAAHSVAAAGDAPEALGSVNVEVDEVAGVLGDVDEAELVIARLCMTKIGGEERGN